MKILVIIVHFGPWPPWINFFLQSCSWNRKIDWLLVSDQKRPEELPPNMQFFPSGLEAFGEKIGDCFGFPVRLVNPYKICDYRPAFGEIFSDHLQGYDYWGYSDLDLIYGSIRTFIEKPLKERADVIGVRKKYLAGHFVLLKNDPGILALYKQYPGYEAVFKDTTHHYGFDERSYLFGKRLWPDSSIPPFRSVYACLERIGNKIKYRLAPAERKRNRDLDQITRELAKNGEIVLFREDLVRSDQWYEKNGKTDWAIVWENGRLTDLQNGEEFLHFHLLRSKKNPAFSVDEWKSCSRFLITTEGIRAQEE